MSSHSSIPDDGRGEPSQAVPDAQPSLGPGREGQQQQQAHSSHSAGANASSLLAAPDIITPSGSPSSPGRRASLQPADKGFSSIAGDRRRSTGHSPHLSPSSIAGPSSGLLSSSPSSSSSGGAGASHHRHARSRSVNLSPVLHSSSALGAARWDANGSSQADEGLRQGFGSSPNGQQALHTGTFAQYPHQMHHPHFQHSYSDSSSSSHTHISDSSLSPGGGAPGSVSHKSTSSPHLRPTSPIYINVSGLDLRHPGSTSSPGSAGSSSEGSAGGHGPFDLSSSPELRKSMLHARGGGIEKANSTGSLGLGPHSPHSPHASLRRAASPSRAFPIPLSPRLQAFGSSSPGKALSHQRRLSGGMLEPVARSLSPAMGGSSPMRRSVSPSLAHGKTINPDPELPLDLAWPSHHHEAAMQGGSSGTETVPVSAQSTLTTPIPPSLRDEVHGRDSVNGVTNIPMPGSSVSSSPRLNYRGATPPVDQYSTSPNMLRRRTPSPSSFARYPDPRQRATSPRSFEETNALAGHYDAHALPPSRTVFDLANQAMQRHRRTRSSTSSGSSSDGYDGQGSQGSDSPQSSARDAISQPSPTHRIVSRPQGSQAKVEAHNALAHVSHAGQGDDAGSFARDDVPALRLPENEESEQGEDGARSARNDAAPYQEHTYAGLQRRASLERRSPTVAAMPRTMGDPSSSAFANGGVPFRAHSPALRGSTPPAPSMLLGESPPKTRSFIGLPPRSGYDLSDDPDDVGSEDGSVGSGRDSVGTDSEEERDDHENDDEQHESSSDGETDEHTEDSREERSQPLHHPRPALPPKRPSLTHGSVVAPMPLPPRRNWVESDSDEAGQADGEEVDAESGDQDGENADERDLEAGESADDDPEQGFAATEDTLSTLERIFLFAKSEMTYHRILVSHSLADWIMDVELSEAVEFVIPLLNGLACDTNEVCMAFAPQLHRVMWHFYRNCPLIEDQHDDDSDAQPEGGEDSAELATRPRISVKTFSPLLCAMLLNSNASIANATQMAIVFFCARLQGVTLIGDAFDAEESEVTAQQPAPTSGVKMQDRRDFDHETALIRDAAAREDRRVQLQDYHFGESARTLIRDEILRSVGLAIGNLHSERHDHPQEEDDVKDEGGDDHEAQSAEAMPSTEGNDSKDSVRTEEEPEASPERQSGSNDAEEPSAAENVESSSADRQDDEMSEDKDAEDINSDEWHEGANGDTSMASGGVDGESQSMSVEEEVAVGRMASLSLLAALGSEDLVPRHFLLENIVPEMIRLATDNTFFVRKEAAVSFGMLARGIGSEEVKRQSVIDVFLQLCRDGIWHVRQAACLSLPNLFAQIEDRNEMRTKLVETMRSFVSDTSRNVRVAALDIIGEAIYLFHDDERGVPEELVRHFLGQPFDEEEKSGAQEDSAAKDGESSAPANVSSTIEPEGHTLQLDDDDDFEESQDVTFTDDSPAWAEANNMPTGWSQDSHAGYTFAYPQSHDADPDRPLVMAYNLPAVALTLGAERWTTLSAAHAELCNHPASKVRRSLAASLHELAKIIGEEAASRDLLPLAERFIDPTTEHDGDVKVALLENIDTLLENVSFAAGLDMIKMLHRHWPNPESKGQFSDNWRLREKLVAKVPHLAKRFLLEDDHGYLVLIVQAAIVDQVSAVRRQAVKSVSTLYELFERHDQVLADGFLGMLIDIAENQDSYRARVATLQCVGELCRGSLQRSSVEMLVLPRLVELSKDEIVDVRIALAALVSLLCQSERLYASPQSHSEPFVKLLQRLAHDTSPAVSRIMSALVPADDPKRARPPSPLPDRPRRELILGPSNGGPHRPPESVQSFDDAAETSTFAMDEEQDGDDEGAMDNDSQLPSSSQRRDSGHAGPVNGRDGDWSMLEEAEDAIPQAKVERYRHLSNGSDDDDGDGDEHMIVLPSDAEDLLSERQQGSHANHAFSSPLSSAIGDIDDDDDDERSPHHLLGVASESDQSGAELPSTLASHVQQTHSPVLESPDRGLHTAKGATDDSTKDYLTSKSIQSNGQSPSSARANHDPFLAFVADKHTEWHGPDASRRNQDDDDDEHDASPNSTPTRPRRQQSLFEDDDDE